MSVYSRPYAEREGSEFHTYPTMTVEYRDASHSYWLMHGETRDRVVSVTSALKVLDKPALLKWAEAAGAEGAVRLERDGMLTDVDPSQVIDIVRINGLGMDAKRDAGADRGTIVHRVLEFWAREREVPDLADYPAEVRGYVPGLVLVALDGQSGAYGGGAVRGEYQAWLRGSHGLARQLALSRLCR